MREPMRAVASGDVLPAYLFTTMRRVGRYTHVLAAAGALGYETTPQLRSACRDLLKTHMGSLHRLLLDLREIHRFDITGTTALVELDRDLGAQGLRFQIVNRADRPAYIATGLDHRLTFVSARRLETIER